MNRILAFVFVCLAASYLAAQPAADNASLAAIEGNSETERQAKASVRSVELPDRNPVELKVFARLGPGPAKENSGIVKSRQHADVFWMHNDSGDEPRIYPIHINGEVYKSERYPETPGVLIGGAINVDWEDISVDSEGHVIVADFGNGRSDRRDLVLYYVDEPSPLAGRTTFKRKVFFRYPDQSAVPAPTNDFNYDAEAIYTIGATVYVLTKHRSDSHTKLYRLDSTKPNQANLLTYIDRFDIQGQAVGADASPDGKRVVVITYDAIWLFELAGESDNIFDGSIRWLPCYSHDHCGVRTANVRHICECRAPVSWRFQRKSPFLYT